MVHNIYCSTLRFLAQEKHWDLAGVDDTGGLHEQVQGSQQERGGNIGGAGKLRILNLVIKWVISNPFGES